MRDVAAVTVTLTHVLNTQTLESRATVPETRAGPTVTSVALDTTCSPGNPPPPLNSSLARRASVTGTVRSVITIRARRDLVWIPRVRSEEGPCVLTVRVSWKTGKVT